MHTANLRKVGGSVMLAVPRGMLDALHLSAGSTVGLVVEDGRLVIEPQTRPCYTLDDLLAQCDASLEPSEEDRHWLDAKPVGHELP
jgi:antitoxin ChpS